MAESATPIDDEGTIEIDDAPGWRYLPFGGSDDQIEVTVVRDGDGWILNADPRAIINSGRWALVALAALALGVLAWLVASGRWTSAMMLAAFMLPVFVQAAPRWRVLFGRLNAAQSDFPPNMRDFGGAAGGFSSARGTTE